MHNLGTSRVPDTAPFDQYRNRIWNGLRADYPTRHNTAGLSGLKQRPDEELHAYIKRAETNWHTNTGSRHDNGTPLILHLFREVLIQGLPERVRAGLAQVVGLADLPDLAWRQNLEHHSAAQQKKQEAELADGKAAGKKATGNANSCSRSDPQSARRQEEGWEDPPDATGGSSTRGSTPKPQTQTTIHRA
ncbi:hypothetical protein NHX12_031936 [Muraenolepis orangiensis]|uniref:Uncharacterized protein n=1 Tax=Muraenolepis orangiensis TaxID=630683 RepID=A0A9Q0E8E8_9TELE|nr:hypothetical protein NHX12_031936 [Muraenolepis orangiensis]